MAAMPPIVIDLLRADVLPDAPAGGCAGAARFALGPGTLLGAMGLLHRGDTTVAVPTVNWRDARVDVLVCLRGGQATIVHCLAALHAQSLQPRRVRLVEDSESRDGSAVLAREFAKANRMTIELVRASGGRDVLLREQATQLDGDVLVVLDAHTVLDSRHYLERCVRALHDGAGIGSVCGSTLPLRDEDRRRWAATDTFRRWLGGDDWRDPARPRTAWGHAMRWLGESYRECVGLVQQRIVQRGQMRALGSICHPSGAVVYRRLHLLQALAAQGERDVPVCGPEEVPVGFALAHQGFRTVQVADAVARVRPPRLALLVAQRMRYTRAFLLSAARHRALVRTPRRPVAVAPVPPELDLRRAAEPYRQPFGAGRTHAFGRPVGWALVSAVLDKVAVPAAMILLLLFGAWGWLAAALAVETGVWLALLALAAPRARIATVARGLVVAPLRYLEIIADALAVVHFISERRAARLQAAG